MKQSNLLIIGFGGHARSVTDIAVKKGYKNIVFVEESARPGEMYHGFQVARSLPDNLDDSWEIFLAAGDNRCREIQYNQTSVLSLPLATIVCTTATLGIETVIGSGTVVGSLAHVGPSSTVGKSCIVNSGCILEHDCHVGDFCHLSVNATIAGRCQIGRRVFIGAGAVVCDKLSIMDDVTIGAGSVVIRDILEPGVYVGVPVRRVKGRS
ncbi:MAG: NeuD/PglB/VioB family sugar acetyltransferase [Pseudomonadota bacterium]